MTPEEIAAESQRVVDEMMAQMRAEDARSKAENSSAPLPGESDIDYLKRVAKMGNKLED